MISTIIMIAKTIIPKTFATCLTSFSCSNHHCPVLDLLAAEIRVTIGFVTAASTPL